MQLLCITTAPLLCLQCCRSSMGGATAAGAAGSILAVRRAAAGGAWCSGRRHSGAASACEQHRQNRPATSKHIVLALVANHLLEQMLWLQ